MVNDDKWQGKYVQFQQLQQHIEQITQHVETLNQQNMEIGETILGLSELEKAKLGDEVLFPLSNGIFIQGELKNKEKLLVNVGADVIVEKKSEQVIEMLKVQQKSIVQKISDAELILQQFQQQAMAIYEEVQKAGEIN